LYRALSEGWIAGAALDVFVSEPVGASPLCGLDNVVLTPHVGASTVEAQDKAGVMVAEAVALALAGEFVPSAVNVAVASVGESVRPFLGLVEKLGRLFTALCAGSAGRLTVEYVGKIAEEETQAVTLSALKGLLTDVVHEPVTYVNAPLLAEERGIAVSTLKSAAVRDYLSVVALSDGEVRVAGTVVGPRNRERLLEVWGYDIDMEPTEHMVFFKYRDRPGIIGTIGEKLGEAGVNIASMQVGRRELGGEQVIAMAIDSAAPSHVLHDIAQAIDAHDVHSLDLR
jgi:D-3-phosphoglycerate dehydrogenase